VIVFVSASHPFAKAKRSEIRMSELDGAPVILRERGSSTRRIFEQATKKAGVRPDYVIETTSRETVKEAVAAGLGVGVISEAELRQDSRFWPLQVKDADMNYTEYVVCLERKKNLRLLSEFFRLIETVGQQAFP
ncbi:MAG: LysR substrate-binding domain-containing protein, partial [Betaproteobacteria bacterium]|nr:LysR substrate-binding domain-containing protein [Betaproteobacteria bacterium]